jgi:nicotinamide-nucleotide amidase
MEKVKTAEVIVIGDELLSGETTDTNSTYLDAGLEALGWMVRRHTTVLDDVDAIASAIKASSKRCQLLLCSGGLGPTIDDLTLAAFASALNCGLRKDESVVASIQAKFEKLGRPMPPNNERQAMVPEIGEVIDNPVGTAPVFFAHLNDADVYVLPGVPRELKWLFKEKISDRINLGYRNVFRRSLKTVGRGESSLEYSIRNIIAKHKDKVQFGFRAIGVENHIKIMAMGSGAEDAIQVAADDLRGILGDSIYGVDQEILPEVVGELLIGRGDTLALAESCSGGLIAKQLTDVAGASAYFLGGCVSYANSAKSELLGVCESLLKRDGAVSAAVAEALATTGVAGPSGGSAEKPVGTVFIALAGPDGTTVERKQLIGNRSGVRENTALVCLELLRQKLL